jgi:hypothetical protein
VIDRNGAQQALFPYNDPGQLPITPLREPNGEWLRLEVEMPGYSVWLRVWQAQVGRVKLYLLDSNDAANFPAHRGITSELYGGGAELRLKQEMALGIGGWRLLKSLGLRPEVCHLNEGHAAFAILERARSFTVETGQPFEVAPSRERAISSPYIRQWKPALTVSLQSPSNNTLAHTPGRSWASRPRICSPWAAGIRRIHRSFSIWLIWPSEEVARSMG